ncbi:hypothetical protein SAMN05216559_0530 [Halomicrobium zhouii]|uniref:Uncharacterized protein n=1 Tax=Halomicrobium zhouii TaxID=767519 RepID=A0A1I6KCI7_9EURY|nr:hypothetical protein SAMN05216559_0530 [Halomicrobium zhouii]
MWNTQNLPQRRVLLGIRGSSGHFQVGSKYAETLLRRTLDVASDGLGRFEALNWYRGARRRRPESWPANRWAGSESRPGRPGCGSRPRRGSPGLSHSGGCNFVPAFDGICRVERPPGLKTTTISPELGYGLDADLSASTMGVVLIACTRERERRELVLVPVDSAVRGHRRAGFNPLAVLVCLAVSNSRGLGPSVAGNRCLSNVRRPQL